MILLSADAIQTLSIDTQSHESTYQSNPRDSSVQDRGMVIECNHRPNEKRLAIKNQKQTHGMS
jgi:hypothetical protein